MRATDQMLARYAGEIEEQQHVHRRPRRGRREGAARPHQPGDGAGHPRPRPASGELNEQVEPLQGGAPDRAASRASGSPRSRKLHDGSPRRAAHGGRVPLRRRVRPRLLEGRRSAPSEAAERLDLYNRAAAHQTTADNPGLLPEPIARAGHQLHRRRPAARHRARPAPAPVRTAGPAEGHAAHQRRRRSRRRRPSSSVAEDDDRARSPVTADHLRRLRQRRRGRTSTGRSRRSWTSSSTTSPASTRTRPRRRCAPPSPPAPTAGPTIPTGAPTAGGRHRRALDGRRLGLHRHRRAQGRLVIAVLARHARAARARCSRRSTRRTRSRAGFSAPATSAPGAMGQHQRHPGLHVAPGFAAGTMLVAVAPPRSRCTRTASAPCRSSSRRVLGVQVAYAGYFAALVVDADRHHRRSRRRHERRAARRPQPAGRRPRPAVGRRHRRRATGGGGAAERRRPRRHDQGRAARRGRRAASRPTHGHDQGRDRGRIEA